MRRLLSFTAFVVSLLAVGAAFLPLSLVPAPRRWHLKAAALGIWARVVLRAFNISISESHDAVNHPARQRRKARVLVANHVSYLDIPVLMARFPCLFLGKAEITTWPIMGWIARRSGMVFVERNSLWSRARSVLAIQERLQAGISLVVFPEGTTSLDGPRRGSANFYSGAFRAARMEDCPVELVYLDYEDPEECAWLGDDDFLSHLWRFLGRRRTQVRLRTEWIDGITDRRAQRRSTNFTRHWLLQSGRNGLGFDSRPEIELGMASVLLKNLGQPAIPAGQFVEA